MSAPPPSSAAYATFSGMHTSDDLSAAEASAAAVLDGEEEDEVVQELPIVLSQELAHTLYLMQAPLRPPHRPYDEELGERLSLKVKPIQKKVEMEYRLEEAGVMYHGGSAGLKEEHRGHNYDYEHPYPIKKLTLSAKPVPPKTNYCAGVLSNGVLHLTPIHAICRFKPSLDYIDQTQQQQAAEAEAKREAHKFERLREGLMSAEEEAALEEEQAAKLKEEQNRNQPQTVIMRVKKEQGGGGGMGAGVGAGGVLRKQTYAFLKQLEEREEWIPLKVHEPQTVPSLHQFNRLLASPADAPPIPFNVRAEHYLSYVNPPDLQEVGGAQRLLATGDPLYLSFEERLLYFMRNCRVVHFGELCQKMMLGTTQQIEQALRELNNICWIVQGSFVIKTPILYDRNWRPGMAVPSATSGLSSSHPSSSSRQQSLPPREQLARTLLVCLFSAQRVWSRDELMTILQLPLESLDQLLSELATLRQVAPQQAKEMDVPTNAQYEFKADRDQQFIKHFPKLVALSEQQLGQLRNEVYTLLSSSTSDPRLPVETRGLLLDSTAAIVHGMAPAGLAADRHTPSAAGSQNTAAAANAPLNAVPAQPASAGVAAWKAHLSSLFDQHGVLLSSFLQEEMFSYLHSHPSLSLPLLQQSVDGDTHPFGPHLSYRWHLPRGNQQQRALVAGLFTNGETVSTAAVRAALPKSVTDEKRREMMKEFATYQASTQAWKLKPGRPAI